MALRNAAVAIFATALGFFAPAPAQAQQFQVPVDGGFTDGQIQFTGQYGIVYYFVWDARIENGNVVICGAGHVRDARFAQTVRGMALGGEVEMAGRSYPFDLTYFTRATSRRALASATETCRPVAPVPANASGVVG